MVGTSDDRVGCLVERLDAGASNRRIEVKVMVLNI